MNFWNIDYQLRYNDSIGELTPTKYQSFQFFTL